MQSSNFCKWWFFPLIFCHLQLWKLLYPANISTLFRRCLLIDAASQRGKTSNQRWNNVCISTLEFTTSNNVESTLWISSLTWKTLDNVETTLSFSTSSFSTLVNLETTLWKWPFLKKQKILFQIECMELKFLTTIS